MLETRSDYKGILMIERSTHSDVKRRFMYQNRPFKSHHLPFDQRVQTIIPPRSPASVPEPIGTSSDGILHRSE